LTSPVDWAQKAVPGVTPVKKLKMFALISLAIFGFSAFIVQAAPQGMTAALAGLTAGISGGTTAALAGLAIVIDDMERQQLNAICSGLGNDQRCYEGPLYCRLAQEKNTCVAGNPPKRLIEAFCSQNNATEAACESQAIYCVWRNDKCTPKRTRLYKLSEINDRYCESIEDKVIRKECIYAYAADCRWENGQRVCGGRPRTFNSTEYWY
jgi:hypothetical protein